MKDTPAVHLQLNPTICDKLPEQIAVAWSGGADSTALLCLLKDAGFAVQAWHIDHAWHADSAQNACRLADQAQQWDIAFHSLRLQKPKQNIEAQARAGRYAAFAQLALQTGCVVVLLGHHANDQAETVCMRLLQGAGTSGCQGMRSERQLGSLQIYRPLLAAQRSTIEGYLTQRHIPWLEDPSNQDTSLWRNKIRQQLFPAMQAQGTCPQRLFLRWQQQAVRLQQEVERLASNVTVQRIVLEQKNVSCIMDWQAWSVQLAPVRAYLLQQMMVLLFADGRVLGRRHILAIEQWWANGGNGWLNLSRCCLYKEGQYLQLVQDEASLRQTTLKDRGKNG